MSDMAARLRQMIADGVLVVVGSAYPASAADPDATALIDEHGYEFGPWQLNERGDKTDGPWSWLLVAVRPDVRADIEDAAPPATDGPS